MKATKEYFESAEALSNGVKTIVKGVELLHERETKNAAAITKCADTVKTTVNELEMKMDAIYPKNW